MFTEHPHREQWHRVGRRFRERFHFGSAEEADENDERVYPCAPHGTCRVQIVRNVSDWKRASLSLCYSLTGRSSISEHLGLIPPQMSQDRHANVTSFLHCAPEPNEDETLTSENQEIADPLSDNTLALWNNTARVNREILTAIFRLVRDWKAYNVSIRGMVLSFVMNAVDCCL